MSLFRESSQEVKVRYKRGRVVVEEGKGSLIARKTRATIWKKKTLFTHRFATHRLRVRKEGFV